MKTERTREKYGKHICNIGVYKDLIAQETKANMVNRFVVKELNNREKSTK